MKTLILFLLFATLSYGQTSQRVPAQKKQSEEKDITATITFEKDSILPNGIHMKIISGVMKKTLFYDEEGRQISKDEFNNSIDHAVNLAGFTENDTLILYKIYKRKKLAKIYPDNSKIIRNYLSEISGKTVDSSKIIIIHFYSGLLGKPSDFNEWKIDKKRSVNRLPKDIEAQQYLVYRSIDGPDAPNAKKFGWLHDKTGLIENTFLPTHFNYGSCIIIMPNGLCYTYFAEYGADEVREGLKKLLSNQ